MNKTLNIRTTEFTELLHSQGVVFGNGWDDANYAEVVIWLEDHGYFTAPASTKYHGAYEGGLFDHSYAVAQELLTLTDRNNLTWRDRRSPAIVGLFHDICKCDQYVTANDENMLSVDIYGNIVVHPQYKWNDQQLLIGHGDKSIMVLSQLMSLTEEEIFCIRYHMGAFTDKDEWQCYTRAVERYPNVLWTHHADMLVSHVSGV